MDPNACLKRLLTAIYYGDDASTVQAAASLLGWLLVGGDVPDSLPHNRESVADALARVARRIGASKDWDGSLT